jgi:hypothetical protein
VKLTRTWSIVLLPLSFATVMAFQNCAPVGSSGVIETASTNKSNDATGNGGTPNPTEPNPEPQPEPEPEPEPDPGPQIPNDPAGCNETDHPMLDDNDRPRLLGWSDVSASNNGFSGYSLATTRRNLSIGMGNTRSGDSADIRLRIGVARGNDPDIQQHTFRCSDSQMRVGGSGDVVADDCGGQFTGSDEFNQDGVDFDEVDFVIEAPRNVICTQGFAAITISIQDQCSRNNTSNESFVVEVNVSDGCLPEEKLLQPNIQYANNNMGIDVDIDGLWVAAAAPEDDEADAGGNSGAVIVYKRAGANTENIDPAATQKLLPIGAGIAGAKLQSVALDGVYLIAGAPRTNVAEGAAWLYKRSGDTYSLVTRIDPPASANGPYTLFGWDVAISGNQFVVTAIRDNEGGTQAGAAYVYTINTTNDSVGTPTKLMASSSGDYEYFGYSADMDNGNIVIGAPVADNRPSNGAGQAYYFTSGSTNGVALFPPASSRPNGGQLGYSVAISGTRAVVGAPRDNGNSFDENSPTGAAFLVNLSNAGNASAITELNGSDGRFGEAVAISGNRLAVTAIDFESGRGTASVFNTSNLGSYFELQARDQVNQDEFGISIAIDGEYSATGAWLDTVNDGNQNWDKGGSVYINNLNH